MTTEKAMQQQLDATVATLQAITEGSHRLQQAQLAYWQEVYKVTVETQTKIAQLLAGQAAGAVPLLPGVAGAQGPLVDMFTDAYNRWMEATRGLYKGPTP